MRDFSTAYFRYNRLTAELAKLREEGKADDATEDKYVERLDKAWAKLSVSERRWIDPPKVTLAEGKADFKLVRDLEEHDEDGKTIRMLWHCNYWDGPLSGVVMYQNREHWFECILEGIVGRTTDGSFLNARAFAVVELKDEEIKELHDRHEAFERHVGTHTTYTYENGGKTRKVGEVAPEKDWKLFYEEVKKRPPLDFSHGHIVAWWGSMMTDVKDSFYDMMTDSEADEHFLTEEEREKRWDPEAWKKREEEFRATDPLCVALLEGAKDPLFNCNESISKGVCYDGWCPDFDEEEPRACKRLAYRGPHTVDLEWATKTGPIKVAVFKDGKHTEDKFFWDHTAEGMKAALEYAKKVLQS